MKNRLPRTVKATWQNLMLLTFLVIACSWVEMGPKFDRQYKRGMFVWPWRQRLRLPDWPTFGPAPLRNSFHSTYQQGTPLCNWAPSLGSLASSKRSLVPLRLSPPTFCILLRHLSNPMKIFTLWTRLTSTLVLASQLERFLRFMNEKAADYFPSAELYYFQSDMALYYEIWMAVSFDSKWKYFIKEFDWVSILLPLQHT